jgi:methylmalonyl-CoA/ethylmalonyl-CoA epimerase
MIQAVDHIGIAVKSLDQAIPRYERAFGMKCSGMETVPGQGVRTAFFPLNGVRIELLEATLPGSPIARFIERHGEGLHHLALRSSTVEDDLILAVNAGCHHLGDVAPTGAGGARIAFLHPKDLCGVLIELCGGLPEELSGSNQ